MLGRVGGRLAAGSQPQKQPFPLPAGATALVSRYARLSAGDGLVCIIARLNFFLNKSLNYHNRFFIRAPGTVNVEAPRLISAKPLTLITLV